MVIQGCTYNMENIENTGDELFSTVGVLQCSGLCERNHNAYLIIQVIDNTDFLFFVLVDDNATQIKTNTILQNVK